MFGHSGHRHGHSGGAGVNGISMASDGQIVPRRTFERQTNVESTNQLANANAMHQDANRVAIHSFGLKEQKERQDETDHQ